MIVKPSIRFLTQDSDSDLVQALKKIIASMTGNASYPKAAALLLLVQAALAEFETALANTADGGQSAFSLKDQMRAALCLPVRSLALDVTDECHGDLTVLLTSGFPIQKPERYPIGELPAPAAPALSLGTHSGELDASVPPIYGALTYNWQVMLAAAPSVVVQEMETSSASATFPGLPPGQVCIVQANVVGTAGTSDWSPATSLMVV
jgi:hypothetical protein